MQPAPSTLLAAALAYAARGWCVAPLYSTDGPSCGCSKSTCGSKGKHPRTKNGLNDATREVATLRKWWTRWPGSNVAIVTGAVSNLVIIDQDPRHGGDAGILTLPPLPETYTVRTGSGGRHYYLRHPGQRIANSAGKLADGIDVRGDGGYVVAPPSIHELGAHYEVLHDGELAAIPPEWLALLCPPLIQRPAPSPHTRTPGDVEDRARRYLAKMPAAISGSGGHLATFNAACTLVAGFDLSTDAALRLLEEYNARCQPPWSHRELEHKIDSADRDTTRQRGYLLTEPPPRAHPQQHTVDPANFSVLDVEVRHPDDQPEPHPHSDADHPPAPFLRTDLGNARLFVSQHGDSVRHCQGLGWRRWDGHYWPTDCTGAVERDAKQTVDKMFVAACELGGDDRAAAIKHALATQQASGISNMLRLAQTELPVAASTDTFDQHPWLLNLPNGTYDLAAGKLRPHAKADHLTAMVRCPYDATAEAPLWSRCLEQWQPDADVRAFLQRLIGYTLTGVIREHVLPILWGGGRNGKGTFVDTLLWVLGDYATQIPAELLMDGRDRHPAEKMILLGKRFCAGSETKQGRRLDVATVKLLTGGDTIRARLMRQDWVAFQPTHKLLLSTNNKPVITETSAAIWERLLLVEWKASYLADSETKPDLALKDKLQAEAAGILRWAIDGCAAWLRQGLAPPTAVRAATDTYRGEEDLVQAFLDACCSCRPGARALASALHVAYSGWASASGSSQLSQRALGEALIAAGWRREKSNGRMVYLGLEICDMSTGSSGRSDDDQYPRH